MLDNDSPAPVAGTGVLDDPLLHEQLRAGRRLRSPDARLLTLLADHDALTTSQLQRLTGAPERTVQHRLNGLYRSGLICRARPAVTRGTSPYVCWLTGFGRAAAGQPIATGDGDRTEARTCAIAVLNECWLTLRDCRRADGIRLTDWRRTPDGLSYHDATRTRRLGVDAMFTATVERDGVTSAVSAVVRLDRRELPTTRMAAPLAAFARYLGDEQWRNNALPTPPVLLVLTHSPWRAERWLTSARELVIDTEHSTTQIVDSLKHRFAVAVQGMPSAAPASEPIWRRNLDDMRKRMVDVLADAAETEAHR